MLSSCRALRAPLLVTIAGGAVSKKLNEDIACAGQATRKLRDCPSIRRYVNVDSKAKIEISRIAGGWSSRGRIICVCVYVQRRSSSRFIHLRKKGGGPISCTGISQNLGRTVLVLYSHRCTYLSCCNPTYYTVCNDRSRYEPHIPWIRLHTKNSHWAMPGP
jgi:hypothetical protein